MGGNGPALHSSVREMCDYGVDKDINYLEVPSSIWLVFKGKEK